MVVLGGYDENGILDDGGVYSLGSATDDDGDGFSECDGSFFR